MVLSQEKVQVKRKLFHNTLLNQPLILISSDFLYIYFHIHLVIYSHSDYRFGLYCKMSQYTEKLAYMYGYNQIF